MDLTEKMYIKKAKDIVITKKGNKKIIENKGEQEGTIILPTIFHCKKEVVKIDWKGKLEYGKGCVLKFVNRKREIIGEVEFNSSAFIKRPSRFFMLALRIMPKTKIIIEEFHIDFVDSYEEDVNDFFKGDILLITPGYPSIDNKYNFGFVHSRVREYKRENWNIDIACVFDTKDTTFYQFENIDVCKTNYMTLRNILQVKKYDKIIIHFFSEEYVQILDATDITNTRVYIVSHGADTIYRDYNIMTARYFEKAKEIDSYQEQYYKTRDEILNRYNDLSNVKWIFGTDWARKRSESLNNIQYKHYEIIPCIIDEDIFKFEKKDIELRKKILIIRKFDDINTYSIDTDVRAILELSKRDIFRDLEFNIYGDGTENEKLLLPLKEFKNVHIHKMFLTHKEIAKVHKENGIALFATRYETQGVSAGEAAMSGLVVISTNVAAVPYIINPEFGTLCDQEDYVQYANKIEELYHDPEKFVTLSQKMHDEILPKCGRSASIEKELKMFQEDENKNVFYKFPYKEQENEIILTVAIPSYNVERYLRNGVFSLINNEVSHKIEVLIINDGSKDSTAKIGRELEELTTVNGKSIVKLIDKENGGHGSTINKGIELARGKYFKLMDGDDYFNTKEFVKLVKILEQEDTDMILNNYVEDLAETGAKNIVKHYEFMEPGYQYNLDDLCYDGYGFENWGPLLSTSTYKTKILKEANFKISEHCFYVDMELNSYAFIYAKTIKYYPLDIYIYYIGRQGQSVSRASYTKNYKHHETVTLKLVKEFYHNKNITKNKRQYLKNKIILKLIQAQYYIITEYLNINQPFKYFDSKIKEYKELYNDAFISSKRVKFHRKTRGILIKLIHIYDKLNSIIRRK